MIALQLTVQLRSFTNRLKDKAGLAKFANRPVILAVL
jgi:hypothetical protein